MEGWKRNYIHLCERLFHGLANVGHALVVSTNRWLSKLIQIWIAQQPPLKSRKCVSDSKRTPKTPEKSVMGTDRMMVLDRNICVLMSLWMGEFWSVRAGAANALESSSRLLKNFQNPEVGFSYKTAPDTISRLCGNS